MTLPTSDRLYQRKANIYQHQYCRSCLKKGTNVIETNQHMYECPERYHIVQSTFLRAQQTYIDTLLENNTKGIMETTQDALDGIISSHFGTDYGYINLAQTHWLRGMTFTGFWEDINRLKTLTVITQDDHIHARDASSKIIRDGRTQIWEIRNKDMGQWEKDNNISQNDKTKTYTHQNM